MVGLPTAAGGHLVVTSLLSSGSLTPGESTCHIPQNLKGRLQVFSPLPLINLI